MKNIKAIILMHMEHFLMLIQLQKNAKIKLETNGSHLQIIGEQYNLSIHG